MTGVMSFPMMVEALERKYGSLNRASRKADIPTTTLLKIKRGSDPRASTLRRIADGLDLTLSELLTEYDGEPGSSH